MCLSTRQLSLSHSLPGNLTMQNYLNKSHQFSFSTLPQSLFVPHKRYLAGTTVVPIVSLFFSIPKHRDVILRRMPQFLHTIVPTCLTPYCLLDMMRFIHSRV